MNIVQKGLLLLLVPLAVQVGLLAFLTVLEDKAQRLAEQESQMSLALRSSMNVTMKLMITAGQIGGAIWDNRVDKSQDPEAFRADVESMLSQARKFEKTSPRALQVLSESEAMARDQYTILKMLRANSRDQLDTMTKFNAFTRFRPVIRRSFVRMDNLQFLASQETADLQKTLIDIGSNRQRIRWGIAIGILIDVSLALASIGYFLNSVRKRLNLLVQNARDIPSRKRLSARVAGTDELAYLDKVLHQAADQLRLSDEHRALVTRMLVHDLRSPLFSSMLSIESLRNSNPPKKPEEMTAQFDSIKFDMKRMISLVEDLLTIEKLEAGKLELELGLFDIAGAVREGIDSLHAVAEANQIKFLNQTTAHEVGADRKRIMQVLMNFLSNALKHSPQNGTVTIATEHNQKFLKVSIHDQGAGISSEKQSHLFQQFYQVEQTDISKGTGLGLAICKLIVTKHGGDVGVSSEPGKGATFWFTLPDEEDAA